MRLGILLTGHVPEDMQPEFGTYPEMFADLFREVDPTVEVETYAVIDGVFPPAVDCCEAWLITGSKHGVYDDLPWIAPLKSFLCDARAAGVPLIGICFGHQIMAEAFGGRAIKSDKGWGCGVHGYQIARRPGWMAEAGDFTMHAMHQDQVVALPDDATVLATNDFCENAMLCYGDPEAPDAISIQPHPEFGRPYAEALIVKRAGVAVPEDRSAAALESFGQPVLRDGFARWCLDYLARVRARERAA